MRWYARARKYAEGDWVPKWGEKREYESDNALKYETHVKEKFEKKERWIGESYKTTERKKRKRRKHSKK